MINFKGFGLSSNSEDAPNPKFISFRPSAPFSYPPFVVVDKKRLRENYNHFRWHERHSHRRDVSDVWENVAVDVFVQGVRKMSSTPVIVCWLRMFSRVLLVIKRIVIQIQRFCFLTQTSRKTSSHRIMWSRERKSCHMFALVWVSCAHLFRLNKIESLLLYVPCIRLHQHRSGPSFLFTGFEKEKDSVKASDTSQICQSINLNLDGLQWRVRFAMCRHWFPLINSWSTPPFNNGIRSQATT